MADAIRFDAANEYVYREASAPDWNSAYTVFWRVYHVALEGRQQELFGIYDSDTGYEYVIANASDQIWMVLDGGAGGYGEDTTAGDYATGTWTDYCLVRSSATALDLYINGTPSLSVATSVSGRGAATGFIWSGTTGWLNGRLTTAHIWSVALSSGEIATQRSYGPAVVQRANLWAEYYLTGASDLSDYSGNGRDLITDGGLTTEAGPSVTWEIPVSVAETGAGSNTLTAQLGATLAETATGSDTATGAAAGTVAEVGTGADALSAQHAATATETGSGSDILTAEHGATAADTGAGADATSGALDATTAEGGAGVDTADGASTASLSEAGAGADAATGALAAGADETGTGADDVSAESGAALAEAGAGADAAEGALFALVEETGVGLDTATAGGEGSGTAPDTGSGTDGVSGAYAASLDEVGAGLDIVTGEGATALAESGAGLDAISALYVATLAEQGAGADTATGFTPGTSTAPGGAILRPRPIVGTLTPGGPLAALTARRGPHAIARPAGPVGTLTSRTPIATLTPR